MPPELRPRPPVETGHPRSGRSGTYRVPQQMAQVAVMATNLAFITGAGLGLGWVIDFFAGTGPWFMVGVGVTALVSSMVRFVKEAGRLVNPAKGRRKPGQNAQNHQKPNPPASPE